MKEKKIEKSGFTDNFVELLENNLSCLVVLLSCCRII